MALAIVAFQCNAWAQVGHGVASAGTIDPATGQPYGYRPPSANRMIINRLNQSINANNQAVNSINNSLQNFGSAWQQQMQQDAEQRQQQFQDDEQQRQQERAQRLQERQQQQQPGSQDQQVNSDGVAAPMVYQNGVMVSPGYDNGGVLPAINYSSPQPQ